MFDGGKIIFGLVVFLGLATFPFWYAPAAGASDALLKLTPPIKGEQCVESKDFMRKEHMQLLKEWRNSVVREGVRMYTSRDFPSQTHEISLNGTCLNCHEDKAGFCDKCHAYMDVSPNCWDCHTDAKGAPDN